MLQVTSGTVQSLIDGGKSVAQVATGATNQLTAEAINLFIVQGCLSVLKFSVVFIIFYMVKKYLEFLQGAGMEEKKVKALKLGTLILSITFFTTQSYPHLMQITEALVAPNVFLLKKGAEFYKEVK